MSRRLKRRQSVDLFNFSFLDVLACVIGLLIFVLTIVVVSGGNSSSSQVAGRLSSAEHQWHQAKTDVGITAARRQRDEQLLAERGRYLANPQSAVDAVRAQIRALGDEATELETATTANQSKMQSILKSLQVLGQAPMADPAEATIQSELRQLDLQTADLQNRADQQRRRAQDTKQVQYYVPHIQEVHRRTLWVEISGDRIWGVMSDDYEMEPLDLESARFTRRAGAAGTSISAMVNAKGRVPAWLANALPEGTILEVALHSDGYEAFRKLRQWAWNKGFGVNWEPQEGNSIILTKAAHVFEQ